MSAITVPVHRLTIDDVYRMVEAGVLDERDRVELVEGVLVEMVSIGAEHDGATAWLTRHFGRVVSDAWELRIQSVLLTAGGYLLADLLLVAPLPRSKQPTTAHLVVEIAQTSQVRDREKARDYAAADVGEYWIVDLLDRAVIVHRQPLAGAYQQVTSFATARRSSRCWPMLPRSTSPRCSAERPA
jgi:Uma2 family endonuclease